MLRFIFNLIILLSLVLLSCVDIPRDNILDPNVITISEISQDSENKLNSDQKKDFTLATFAFDSISLGTSFLNISYYDLSDASGLETLSVDEVLNASISVVPEPATGLLLIAGMAGMGVFGRKKFRGRRASTG